MPLLTDHPRGIAAGRSSWWRSGPSAWFSPAASSTSTTASTSATPSHSTAPHAHAGWIGCRQRRSCLVRGALTGGGSLRRGRGRRLRHAVASPSASHRSHSTWSCSIETRHWIASFQLSTAVLSSFSRHQLPTLGALALVAGDAPLVWGFLSAGGADALAALSESLAAHAATAAASATTSTHTPAAAHASSSSSHRHSPLSSV